MSVFLDTSAFLAVLNAEDQNHGAADEAWKSLLDEDKPLVSTNSVPVESTSLALHRLRIKAIQAMVPDVIV